MKTKLEQIRQGRLKLLFRPTDGLVVMDCRVGNLILGKDSLLYPIDVIPVEADAPLLAKLGTES